MNMPCKIVGSVALCLSLLACGGDDDDPADDTTTTTEEPPETTESTAPADDEDDEDATDDEPAGDQELTPLGEQLAVGDTAILPGNDDGDSVISVTVTAIEPGEKAEFDEQFGENAAGIDPIYVHYSVEVLVADEDNPPSVPGLRALNAEGRSTGVVVSGSLSDCESSTRLDNEVGATAETCRLQGIASGESFSGVHFNDGDYFDDPVVWSV